MPRLSRLLFLLLTLSCLMQASSASAATTRKETIVLGGGCFWCLDAAYRLVPGVVSVECGYAGGGIANPDYHQVCSGSTGHAEVVRIVFDPEKVTLARLLELFWHVHDPTTPNQQGNDVGTQYRSIILFASPAQRQAAEKSIAEAAPHFKDPIVTELVPLADYWRAEEYHQDYFNKNPGQGYCRYVVRTKVDKMRKALGTGEKHP